LEDFADWIIIRLFGGFLVPEKDTPWPLRACGYLSPLKFASKAVMYAELHGTTFEGAVLDSTQPNGFACPGSAPGAECYGATGDQALQSMKNSAFKYLNTEDEFFLDCGIILAIAVAFRLLYFAFAAARCSNSKNQVVPPATNSDELPPQSLALGLRAGHEAEEPQPASSTIVDV